MDTKKKIPTPKKGMIVVVAGRKPFDKGVITRVDKRSLSLYIRWFVLDNKPMTLRYSFEEWEILIENSSLRLDKTYILKEILRKTTPNEKQNSKVLRKQSRSTKEKTGLSKGVQQKATRKKKESRVKQDQP